MKNSSAAMGQIKTLLAVLASGVIFALLLALFMVQRYSFPDEYKLKNILLSPQVAQELTGDPIAFDHLEYAYLDSSGKGIQKRLVDLSSYAKFYAFVEDDRSGRVAPADVAEAFNRAVPATLTLFVRSKVERSSSTLKAFQTVEFALDADHYRVELHLDLKDGSSKWAYFSHPGLKDQLSAFFPSSSEPREK